jgi:peptidoglycan/xylan/chitin deacetylase (PgdA/CDA1 family)
MSGGARTVRSHWKPMNPRPKKLRLLRWLPMRLVLTTAPAADRALYLSFDDGPHPDYTPRLLDLLAAHDARASFFLLGEEAERHPRIVERMVAEGHLLGNHSWNHPNFTRIDWREQLAQIEATDRVLERHDGRSDHLFRPPSGHFTASLVLRFALRKRGIAYWSYDSLDYQRRPAEALVGMLRADPPRAGDVVLMHDDSEATHQALHRMLPEWRAAGFALRVLPQRAAA